MHYKNIIYHFNILIHITLIHIYYRLHNDNDCNECIDMIVFI